MSFGYELFISVVYATMIFFNIWNVKKALFRRRVSQIGIDMLWIHLAADMEYAIVRQEPGKESEILVALDKNSTINQPIPHSVIQSILLHEKNFNCEEISENEWRYIPNSRFIYNAHKKYNALYSKSRKLVRQYEGFPLMFQRSLEEEYSLVKNLYEELSEDSDNKREEE